MHVRFLLGPAGSGKTCRCLNEVQRALAAAPEGPPLILLAPKQATFQLERQILGGDPVQGYTRLHILSFDRLATFIFGQQQVTPPKLLSSEGRLMVLRALLLRHGKELELFGQSAKRTGFAQQLAGLLAELRQQQFTALKLQQLSQQPGMPAGLCSKLRDLARLQARYDSWLATHGLQDADCYLDLAVAALRQPTAVPITIQQLWLDGFAEMTPQELDLLTAVLPLCERATLAFCLESEPVAETSRLSIWSAIGKTYQQCLGRLPATPDCRVEIETLRRGVGRNRFERNAALRHIEQAWTWPEPEAGVSAQGAVNLVACPNPEAEAVYAARAILKFVRAGKGEPGKRFRDCAVLVRQLDGYHQPLGRVFRRYGIPFFLDRRENVTHHPLAELTRSALRTVTFDWRHDDWFAALKTGFCRVSETAIDGLENAALEFGWQGKKWREPLPDENWERLRQDILPPFADFAKALNAVNFSPSGKQLAEAIRALWAELKVESVLERWSETGTQTKRSAFVSIHATVWEQMNEWLDNVEEAFADDPLTMREWLPVLEAGLAGLTVGVIPPVLDEVLVGAIDRSRNPDLKYALLLGVNEMVFPATPATPVILTNADRDVLEAHKVSLGANLFDQLARERYLGYIACTRASEKLTVTFSRQDASDNALNPSTFVTHLQRMFGELTIEEFSPVAVPGEVEHVSELAPWLVGQALESDTDLLSLPALQSFREKIRLLREPDPAEALAPAWAERLYGRRLRTSVSRLEEFAKCPFRFLVNSGLRVGERKLFELDARERGNFQHDILEKFHGELMAERRQWRDLTTGEARERIGLIAAELTPAHRHGLLQAEARSAFAARMLTESLQDFVETLILWMHRQYQFDPTCAEIEFDAKPNVAPAWEIELDAAHQLVLRGRIDRIDIYRAGERALCVVMDYKSSQRKLDNVLLAHGVQLQLLAYLATVRRWPASLFGAKQLDPAGVFYVNLRGLAESAESRAAALANPDETRRLAYRHAGRFNVDYLEQLDKVRAADQFNYRLKNDGTPYANSAEALGCKEFTGLLDQVEEKLREMGQRIFAGEAKVDPYRKSSTTACDYCEYQAVCRIDPWTHGWRVLRAVVPEESESL